MQLADSRPNSLDEIIGLDHNKNLIKYHTAGAIKLQEKPRSYIAVGPSGTGKSTIAGAIATITGGNLFKYLGSDIQKPSDVYDIAVQLSHGDVCIIEEAQTLKRTVQAILLEWLENFKILGGAEFNILEAPVVTFVFPTTNAGYLSKAFRERCVVLTTNYYSIDDLKLILLRAGNKVGLDLSVDDEALTILAQSSRGTPRVAVNQRLDLLRKIMAIDSLPFNVDAVYKLLEINHINKWGLDKNDLTYCKILYKKIIENRGKPVAKHILMSTTGFEADIIENIIEPYLHQIGIIKIESKGRVLTDAGYGLLGYDPIPEDPINELRQVQINKDQLIELIKDEKLCRGGMKALAPKLGLRYGPDNHKIIEALNEIGYTSKRAIGITQL